MILNRVALKRLVPGARLTRTATSQTSARHPGMQVQASYNKQGQESLDVDGRVTRLWKVFFKPGSGYTDRLGIAIPLGSKLDERTEEERWKARQDAARGAVNIDREERERRIVFGTILLVVTGVIVKILIEKHAGPLERLYVLPTFFLGAAEMASGISGLWSIALADVWDVDGTGMQTVPDFKLSKKIRRKVISFVGAGAVATVFVVGAFCAIPL